MRSTEELGPLDGLGILVTFTLLGAVVLGITRVGDEFAHALLWPWACAAAAVLLAMLVAIERRAARPLIPLTLFLNRQLAIVYGLALGAGFGMGSVIFVSSIATVGYGVTPNRVGFVLLPLVVASMLGSTVAGRLLNRIGARGLLLIGFALLGAGYAAVSVTNYGLPAFLAATVPVGAGIGVVVGGALRSIAIDEAPASMRTSAQGLINIFNAIGTLLAAAAVSAVADFKGGGTSGFAIAYLAVAVLMALMAMLTLGLRKGRSLPGHSLD